MWIQLGAVGLLVIVLIYYNIIADRRSMQRDKTHAIEREKWRIQIERQHQMTLKLSQQQHKEALDASRNLEAIINEVKGYLTRTL